MNEHCCNHHSMLWKWTVLALLALLLAARHCQPLEAAESSNSLQDTPTESSMTRTVEEGPVTLTVQLNRTSAQVAEPIELTLTAIAPQGVRVRFPEPPTRLGEFDVTATTDTFDVPAGPNRIWTRVLHLESLRSGSFDVPSLELSFSDERVAASSELLQTISSPTLLFNIVSEVEANADPTQFRDIKGLAEMVEPATSTPTWIIVTAAGGSILTLAGAWLLLSRSRPLSAAQWAIGELGRIEENCRLETSSPELSYCKVIEVLREYIGRHFDIRAPQLTTPEFLSQAESRGDIDTASRESLQTFLKLADGIKFARFRIQITDVTEAIHQGRQFIQQTSTVPLASTDGAQTSTSSTTTTHSLSV